MEQEKNKGRVSVKTVIKSILSGDILLLMRVDRALPYILFLFVLGWINIFLNYKIEQTMVEVERNKVILENYKIYHAQKTYEFVKMGRISTVESMLEKGGSKLTTPTKPAETIITD
jgi:hypothetical protein